MLSNRVQQILTTLATATNAVDAPIVIGQYIPGHPAFIAWHTGSQATSLTVRRDDLYRMWEAGYIQPCDPPFNYTRAWTITEAGHLACSSARATREDV